MTKNRIDSGAVAAGTATASGKTPVALPNFCWWLRWDGLGVSGGNGGGGQCGLGWRLGIRLGLDGGDGGGAVCGDVC